MSITSSKYYFNIDIKDKKNIYGLLNILENRFYIIDNNYEILKFIQFLFMRGHQWYTMVDLSSILNKEKIENNNCHLFGCLDRDIKSTNIDLDLKEVNSRIIERNIDLNFFNYSMQEKIFFIRKLIAYSKNIVEDFKEKESNSSGAWKRNLSVYKDFLNIILPNDKQIDLLVASEIKNIDSIHNYMSDVFNKVIFVLNSIDLKSLSIEEIKNNFKNKLQNEFSNSILNLNDIMVQHILDYINE